MFLFFGSQEDNLFVHLIYASYEAEVYFVLLVLIIEFTFNLSSLFIFNGNTMYMSDAKRAKSMIRKPYWDLVFEIVLRH